MKTSEGDYGKGGEARQRLNTSQLNRGGRFSCLRAIPVNIDVDVRTTLLRISYKARGLDSLPANCKHLKSHATPGLLQVCEGETARDLHGVKSYNHMRELSSLSRFTAHFCLSLSLFRWFRFPLSS